MKIDKRHFSPVKAERQLQYFHPIYKMGSSSRREFERVEQVLDAATCDIINGKSKSDVLLKLEAGLYEGQKKGISHRVAEDYYKAILSRLKIDEPDLDNAKTAFYSMYLNLYNEAMEDGNNMQAKQVLDSMVKLMGLDKPTTPQTAIQVNSTGDIKIKFGFSEDNNDGKNDE